MAGVRGERRDFQMVLAEFQFADPLRIDIEHHRLLVMAVQGMQEQGTGLAAPGEQIERLAQTFHPGRETVAPYRPLQRRVLQKPEDGANAVEPDDDGEVDGDDAPRPLGVAERRGDFAEAYGGGGVADEIEGMEKIHGRRRPPFGIHAWDQRHAQNGNGITDDQKDQRRTHAPQDQKQGAVHVSGGTSPFPPAA